ncbi:MAG: hypothetical protein EOP51_10210 [Sphingobacteriales bacterium]|nr:MAG: hypothetical protein EOP51_10210 [Sphingobacteriales bacterium]
MKAILLQALAGTWFVVGSNFPMWLKGDKHNPTFNYTVVEKRGEEVLKDEVKYDKNVKQKVIAGTDHLNKEDKQTFTWRGKGLLFIAKSKWQVKLMDEHGQWAVIYFSKTLFTPEGVDIISRTPRLDSTTYATIKERMSNNEILQKHVADIVAIPQP